MGNKAKEADETGKVRLQVTLCPSVALSLARHAKELDRSQAWVAAWALRVALDDPKSVSTWILKRLKRPGAFQEWKSSEASEEIRLQMRVEAGTAKELELASIVLNQSPLKLAGLLIGYSLEDEALALAFLKTWPGKMLRRLVRGDEDLETHDDLSDVSARNERECDDVTKEE